MKSYTDWLKNVSLVNMRIRQGIMTLNGNAGVGTVNVITKNFVRRKIIEYITEI